MLYLRIKLILLFSILINIYSQDPPPTGGDMWIKNTSPSNSIWVRIYPVSVVFNAFGNCDFHAMTPLEFRFDYINGRGKIYDVANTFLQEIPHNGEKLWAFDDEGSYPTTSVSGIGKGAYKIEFYWKINNVLGLRDSLIFEIDAGGSPDFSVYCSEDESGMRLASFGLQGCTSLYSVPSNRKINIWEYECPSRTKNPGSFVYDDIYYQNINIFPQDFRKDCNSESYDYRYVNNNFRSGVLTLNILINKNIRTRTLDLDDDRYDMPTYIIISPLCTLTINNDKKYEIKYDSWFHEEDTACYNKFIVMPEASLVLNNNAKLIFEMTNHFYVKPEADISLFLGSVITMKSGSTYCNESGNRWSGSGYIYVERGVKYCLPPNPSSSITELKDSIKIYLDTCAVFEIPDSTTYSFEGKITEFICDSGATVKFGKNSKLIFSDGAKIKAKYTKFTSLDSNATWDGIYFNDVSYDTLKNCTLENALNGINIADNTSLYDVPAVEISNCTFSNKTDQTLLNQVYVNNASNVMIRNSSSSSLISEGFASGIILEYCSGGVSIIDNNINFVTSGINVIQSSPHIARNTITGTENSGNGIYLDNSNGTIEYNTIGNFENSMLLYYSSPYVLKNHFNDASLSAVALTAVSVPVMKPIISGTELRWLGGNNYLTGSPENAGMTYNSDAYPLIDSGYNVISVGNSLYIQGTLTTELKARVNNWYDNPPVSEKFDAGSMGIDYSEYFDGQTLPGTDYYELNSIGFGLYDTVYIDDLETNTLSPEDMYIIAYRKEMENRYSNAINAYKEVISAYKTSNYAVSSLARIFNCLDKMKAGTGDYNTIKSFYTGIKNSNNYPVQVRELSEDLAIKSKVRMGQIADAISDYEAIINNFPNTPKGTHAQVNKICLENMQGSGNMMMNGHNNNASYKSKLLTLISGKEPGIIKSISTNLPKHFRLYQNYPNPFNPMTTIKYEIPKDGNIKLTVYDITGREIISINEYRQAGVYTYTFDGTNIASGVYIYKIETGVLTETRKMVLIK